MFEWHITPDYIINNWTDELLNLMTEKLVERKQGEIDAMKGTPKSERSLMVPESVLFAHAKNLIKVVKKT